VFFLIYLRNEENRVREMLFPEGKLCPICHEYRSMPTLPAKYPEKEFSCLSQMFVVCDAEATCPRQKYRAQYLLGWRAGPVLAQRSQ
jgi:hypothetical protein